MRSIRTGSFLFCLSFAALLLSALLACSNPVSSSVEGGSSGGSGSSGVPSVGNISGTVVDSVGGAPVEGAAISALVSGNVEGSAVTDSSGQFSIADIPVGSYDVTAAMTGRAGSRVQSVAVSGNATTSVHLVQELPAYSAWNAVPPTITVSGVNAGSTYGVLPQLDVSATAAAGSAMAGTTLHPSIKLSLTGAGSSDLVVAESSNGSSLSYSGSAATSFMSGNLNIVAVAYDNNNNRAELIVPVVIAANGAAAVPAAAPSGYHVTAETFGSSLRLFDVSTSTVPPVLRTTSGVALSLDSAQADSTSIVLFEVPEDGAGDAIAVYRGSSTSGPFSLIGESDQLEATGSHYLYYVDSADTLVPGQTYYYRIAYVNNAGAGPFSAILAVPVLQKYTLYLQSPADQAVISAAQPTLTWSVSGSAGSGVRTDEVIIRRADTGLGVLYRTVTDATSYAVDIPLDHGVTYLWNVASSTVQTGGPGIASVSYPSVFDHDPNLGTVSFSNNGSFAFVIQ